MTLKTKQTYLIEIDEEQRLALVKLFKGAVEKGLLPKEYPDTGGLPEPLDFWESMLESLPVVDAEMRAGPKAEGAYPQPIHGFCL